MTTDSHASPAATILLVEDDVFIGQDLKRILVDGGYAVGGPFTNEQAARDYLAASDVDAAVLDVNLGRGRTSLGLAASLAETDVPFAFVTGYAAQESHFEGSFADAPRLGKPSRPDEVLSVVKRMVG